MSARYRVSADASAAMAEFLREAASFLSLIDRTREALIEDVSEHRDHWDSAAGAWASSDRGVLVDEWITDYEALLDLLEQVHDTLEPAVSGLEALPVAP